MKALAVAQAVVQTETSASATVTETTETVIVIGTGTIEIIATATGIVTETVVEIVIATATATGMEAGATMTTEEERDTMKMMATTIPEAREGIDLYVTDLLSLPIYFCSAFLSSLLRKVREGNLPITHGTLIKRAHIKIISLCSAQTSLYDY